MSYIDAVWNRDNDIVYVVERDSNRKRVYQEYPARYIFYYPDPKGKHQSIFGDSLTRVVSRGFKEFQKEQKIYGGSNRLFENDINPIFRCLEENYLNKEAPKLNVAFFDIETDMQPYAYPSGHKVKIRKKLK